MLEVNVNLPSWVMVLKENHWSRESYQESVKETVKDIKRLRDVDRVVYQFSEFEFIESAGLAGIELGTKGWQKLICTRLIIYMIKS
nr:hypothetical protein P5630_16375 [Bacillus subtilis]